MNTTLTQQQIDQYQRDGALIYRGFLSEAEVDSLLGNISKAVREMGDSRVARNADFGKDPEKSAESDTYDDVFVQRLNLRRIGAGANMTPGYRRAMTCAYMPEGSTFNGKKNILPDDYVASLSVGDVLDNDALNPVVWPQV